MAGVPASLEAPEDFVIRWTRMKIVRSGADLAVSARDITEPKMHVAEMQRRGNEDALTGLPNRHWVENTLPLTIERAAASDSMLALLFIDLDQCGFSHDVLLYAINSQFSG